MKSIKLFVRKLLMLINDKNYIHILYFIKLHKILNIQNPQTFNEKLQWIKLNVRNNLMTQCVDKLLVRDYVKSNNLERILNKLIGVFHNVDQINFELLPNKFVIKTNHGSSQNIIVKNKDLITISKVKKLLRYYLKFNHFIVGREWPYKNVEPRIIIEQFLEEEGKLNTSGIKDYKVFCFNGKPHFIQVDIDRFNDHKRDFYDLNWNKLKMTLLYENSSLELTKPKNLKEMVNFSAQLSNPFLFCRVDFYEVQNTLIFGEITFFPENGMVEFSPYSINEELGNLLNID
jgi:hypothetical protein